MENFKIPEEIKALQTPEGFLKAIYQHSRETGLSYTQSFYDVSGFFESVFGYRKYSEIRSLYSTLRKKAKKGGKVYNY